MFLGGLMDVVCYFYYGFCLVLGLIFGGVCCFFYGFVWCGFVF